MWNSHVTRLGSRALAAALVLAAFPRAQAQSAQTAITLVKPAQAEAVAKPAPEGSRFSGDYRAFGDTRVGESAAPEVFTLEFHETANVTEISATADFHVSGGSCGVGHTYAQGDICSVEVVFTPQGPGHRTGKVVVAHSASPQPFLVPAGGNAYGPAVAFIPAQITTVPGTYPGGVGLLMLPQGLAVDGGDNLYVADTGNDVVRYRDSNGSFSVVAGQNNGILIAPYGVATDRVGGAWISDPGEGLIKYLTNDGYLYSFIGNGPGGPPCTIASPCNPMSAIIGPPYGLAIDPAENLFFTSSDGNSYGAFLQEVKGPGLFFLGNYNDFLGSTQTYPLAVDGNDSLYFTFEYPGDTLHPAACYILGQDAGFSIGSPGGRAWSVAGTRHCGFSGDGGLATGAEISTSVQGFAWDAAGDLYFTDLGNNRVRRISASTGIIRTVAGNGGTGYSGDNGPATSAAIYAPSGVAVDSRGNVYSTSRTGTIGNAVVRQIGPAGQLNFALQAVGVSSNVQTISVSNAGNAALNFTRVGLTAGNTSEFAIDANTTNCNFTAPLYAGAECLIGVTFTPAATGTRSATLTLLDNTVTGSNTIHLAGVGALAAKAALSPGTLTFASQKAGTSSAAKTVTLTNSGGLPLTISGLTFGGANPTYFSQINNCVSTMAARASCGISVIFTPLAAGSPAATFTVATSAGSPAVTISGTSTTVKPKVTLTSRANPVASGLPAVLNATVAGAGPTKATGKVQLREGKNVLAVAALAAGAVTFKVASLSAGTHVLTAYYVGDKQHAASQSPSVKQVVGPVH